MEYGIGIVGTGLIADFHARAIEGADGARLVSVLSRTRERAKEAAERLGCRGEHEATVFFDDPEMDIVSICTPSGAHMEPALQAIRAGKHLIIEKPLEISLKRIDTILNEAAKKGVRVSGVFQSRFFDGSRVVKKAVDAGRFGRMILGDAYVKWFRSQEYYDTGVWKGTRRFDGGGTLMNQSIHAIDLLQWYMGPVESVTAHAATLGHERMEVEDTAVATLAFSSGALGVIEGSTAVYPGFLKRIELSGTGGTAVLEEEELKVWSFTEELKEDGEIRKRFGKESGTEGGASDPGAINFEGHRRQFEDFVSALREERTPAIDAQEARKAVAIILAIYESAATGRRVKMKKFS